MTNRLLIFLRATPFFVGLCLLLLPTTRLLAQPGFFNFSYNGPTTLAVGPTCSSMLQGNVPDPVVTSTVGATITMSMFDPVASMFQYNDLFTSGTTAHVFWFVKDNMGHSNTYEYFINFVDNSPPVFDLTGILDTLQFSSVAQVPTQAAIPVVDNCTPIAKDTFYQTTPPGLCLSGTFTRTWKATDTNNNTAVFTQTIIVYKDSLPPQITGYPQDGSASCVNLATAYPLWLANQISTFAAIDASGIKSLSNNAPAVFPPGCKMPLTVRFKAVDNCQFQINVDVIFTTSDNKGPIVVKPPKDTVAYCSQTDNEQLKLREWISTKAYSQAFDSCSFPLTYTMKIGGVTKDSAQVVAAFNASFSGGCSTKVVGTKSYNKVHGFVSVDLFVQDACGNQTFMGNVDFGAIDTLPPVITGVNKTEQCGGGNDQSMLQSWINTQGGATVVDDCSDFTWTNFSFTSSNGQSGNGNFGVGPYPIVLANNCTWFTDVTFRVTDDCGNSSTKTLRWSIIDNQVPTFTGLQPDITVYCPNPLPSVPAAIVSDNCDANVAVTFSRIYKDSICDGSYTVLTTWIATDDCGNSATATQNIFVSDTTRPIFTLVPPNKTFRCDTFVLPPVPVMGINVAAVDVCSQVVSITTTTVSFQNPDPDSCSHYSYNILRTFMASDKCGNTQTATQVFTIIDNLGPVKGGILDTTALCSALIPFPAPVPLAFDACSGPTAPPVSTGQTIIPGNCTDTYTISVQWVATDVCGNTTGFDQLVHVIDTVPPTLFNIPPNITVECDAIPAAPNTAVFNATDNCNAPVIVNLVESETRNPDTTTCEHWSNYIVKREWIATDNCGNTRTYTQLIQIEDTTPPTIVPPSAMVFPNDAGDCGAEILIPGPLSVTDVCSDQFTNVVISDFKPLVASGPGSPTVVPVASMFFQLIAPNTPPFKPVVNAPVPELRVTLDNADAEGPLEFLFLHDEKNQVIDTLRTTSQCGDKTYIFPISATVLNDWLRDGIAKFSVVPNGTGPGACNPVCPNGKVTASLKYTYSSSDAGITLNYTVDGGPLQSFPPSGQTFLGTGVHTVVYIATDCSGNSSTSSVLITINDVEPPSLVAPANITAFTGLNNCESTVTLPFPAITENCLMSGSLNLASAILPLHFETDPDVGVVASDITPTLTGLIPNAVGGGFLKIRHKGDNAQPGEFFNIFDESFNALGTTGQGTSVGECSTFYDTIIPVSAAQINSWAANGNTSFYLTSNRDLLNYTDFVSNCAPLLPNGTDGISQIQVVLEYSYAVVNFSVKNPTNQVVASGTLTGNSTTVTLPPANYKVMYTTADNAGLTGMTMFSLTVRDTVKPKAKCLPTLIIQVGPSGGIPYTLLPASINNGSFDNCTPIANLNYSVTPNVFSCSQAGTNVNVALTVTDTSGNSSVCHTIVLITNTPPTPTYTPVCENFTLQLFANPPSNLPFTYLWSGPNGFFSTQQNPIVSTNAMASDNGTYCVTITGATLCTSSSCVVVKLAILGAPPTLSTNGISFCPGENILLSTSTYNGQNVSYQWLKDTTSGPPVVIGTTMVNNFTVTGLAPGTYTFYLKVFANGCNTSLSNSVTVTVHPRPPADAVPEMTLKCEGEAFSLESLTPPTGGLTYMWTGPPGSGFTSTAQIPVVTNSAVKSQHEGKYILVTKQNGCLSIPDTVMVTINSKPAKPTISGDFEACAGENLTFVCTNTPNASQYLWTMPSPTGPLDVSTNANILQVPNVGNQNEGCYSVIVFANSCFSDASVPACLDVQNIPEVTPSSNSPICMNSVLNLTASFSSEVPLTWCWIFPDSTRQFVQNISVPNGTSGTYTLIGKTSYGCADTATTQVLNVIPPVITAIGNNAPPCCDFTTDAILSATVVSTNGATYSWTGPGNPPFTSTMANPVIVDVCTVNNGAYKLIVKDTFGCPSLEASTDINIQLPPLTPNLMMNPNRPICEGETMTLSFNNTTTGATYTWHLPNGTDTTTNTSTFQLINAQPGQSGKYSVTAKSADGVCSSGASIEVIVTINPIPPIPGISSNSPVCQGGVLMLFGTSISGVTYRWSGPAAFIDTVNQNPIRQPVALNMAGTYKLKVSKDGCTSPEVSILVEVVPTPEAPTIVTPPTNICIDGPVNTFLNILNLNPVNGMVFTWKELASTLILQSSTSTSLNLGMPNVLALGPGPHSFQVIATTAAEPGCNSAPSNIVTITFDTIPDAIKAFAGVDRFACVNGNAIQLMATPPAGNVKGLWTQIPQPATVTIDNANLPNASFVGIPNTIYTFQWSLSNGACADFSKDTVQITTQVPEVADAGADSVYCSPVGIRLHAKQGVSALGFWTQSSAQAQIPVVIDNPTDPNTTISGNLNPGQNYVFEWVIGNTGCGTQSDKVTIYIYSTKPNAGPVQFVCDNQNCAELGASILAGFETGAWSSNTGLSFTNPNASNTTVCGLSPGQNEIYWTINGGKCGNQSRDTVVIFYEIFPTAVNDDVYVAFGDTAHFNILLNDILPSEYSLSILTPPTPGAIINTLGSGQYVYRPQSGFTGTDATMTYLVCNTKCPSSCSIGTVTFHVGGAPACYIPTIITPNADGFNDQFKIPVSCTLGEGESELEVTIFNQWGDVVFHAKPYNNDWGGTYNTKELPAGTYFYVVKLNDKDAPRKGFLLIQR